MFINVSKKIDNVSNEIRKAFKKLYNIYNFQYFTYSSTQWVHVLWNLLTWAFRSTLNNFILVGCILLRYFYILYIHTTQKLYICDPQTQLNNFFTLPKSHYMFRPLLAIFRWYFWRFLTLLQHIHHLYKCEAIYCFLICMYTMLRKFIKYTIFYTELHIKFLHKMHT
jgi:hypothetical protein